MHTRQFNYTNPEHIVYVQGILQMIVMGGIRLEGLDRMRTTLKISQYDQENKQSIPPSLRHNLDLYNDTQIEKLIRKAATKLEIGTSVITAALEDLTELLEEYRLTEREKRLTETDQTVYLKDEQRKASKDYLSKPKLLERTNEDIGKSGVVGEEKNRLLMLLIFAYRKQQKPLHIISLGSSGAGKTHLQETVSKLIPPEDKIVMTSISENALYYFGQRQLRNKLLLFEDLDGIGNAQGSGASYALRELQSKNEISKTVVHKNSRGETKTIHLKVEGPVSIAGCTTKEKLYEDNANRCFLIYIDESEEQDERVMNYQGKLHAGKVNTDEQEQIINLMQNCQRILKPIKIINPYAEHLRIPKQVFKPRRSNAHYLAFIEAVTFYHQYQRESMVDTQTGELYIETTIEDIESANELMKEVLIRKSDELTGACRNYFEDLKQWLNDHNKTTFRNREVRLAFRIPGTTIRRYHNQLMSIGYMKKNGKKATGYTYQIMNKEEYQTLKQSITTVLDEILEKIKCASEPIVSHSKNGSPKSKKTSKKRIVNQ